MKQLMVLVVVSLVSLVSSRHARADEWSSDNWVYGSLSAATGGTLGAVAGGLAGSLLDGSCTQSASNDCTPAFTIAGIGAGLILGSARGASWYGKRHGLHGSFSSAVIGAVLGNVASGSVVVLAARTIDNGAIGFPIVAAALIGFPAIGATIMYKRSDRRSDTPERVSAALLEVTPERVAIQAPIVGLGVTRSEIAVLVPLAGGTF